MSKFKKKLLGFLTAWPFAYILLFMMFIFGMIALEPDKLQGVFAVGFLLVLLVHFLTILLIFGLQIFYIVDVFRNDRVKQDQKVLWVLALFFGSLIAMPIYWYINIWREVPGEGQYRGLSSGDAFDPARSTNWETQTGDPVPPEPHSWR